MKWHRIAGTVLIALCGLALIGSASAKFAQVPRVVTELNAFGFQGKLLLIATGEALSAVLFLVPRTRSIGLLLVSGLLGGAIATHMQHGQSYVGPAVLPGWAPACAIPRSSGASHTAAERTTTVHRLSRYTP